MAKYTLGESAITSSYMAPCANKRKGKQGPNTYPLSRNVRILLENICEKYSGIEKGKVLQSNQQQPVSQAMAVILREGIQNAQNNDGNKMLGMVEKPKVIASENPNELPIKTLECTKYLYLGFRILGLYMPDNYKILYALYSFIVNGLVTMYLTFAFTMTFFRFSDTGTETGRWLTSIQMAIDIYACAIKVVIMAFMIRELHAANPIMERLDARCLQADDIAELHKLSRRIKRVLMFLTWIYWFYLTMTALVNVVSGNPPYALYFPYLDWRNSRWEFVITSLFEYGLMNGVVLQEVCCDAYGVIYVCILRTHMKILSSHVRKLCKDKEMSAEQNIEELKLCIKDHKALLELFNVIEPAISLTIFVQFMVTAAIIGTALVNILLFATDEASIVASTVYIFAVSCETFLLCYYAQCFIADSVQLTETIFHSSWIDQGPKYGKMLAFFMKNTQLSMEMMAGKLIPITLNSFVNIAKFSFSLFTFIRRMNMKHRL